MKYLITLTLYFSLIINLFAGGNLSKNSFDVKLSYNKYPYMDISINKNDIRHTSSITIDGLYQLNRVVEAGIYLGFGKYSKVVFEDPNIGLPVNKLLLFYGINANLKILPLFFKKDHFWIEPYIYTKLGSCCFTGSSIPEKNYKEFIEYGIYGGIALYPGKHWGLFYEHGFGNFVNWRTGLSLKF
jgi:hypothetical protein